MYIKRKLLSIMLLTLSTIVNVKAYRYSGFVLDKETDGPLGGVSVSVRGADCSTETSPDGSFDINCVDGVLDIAHMNLFETKSLEWDYTQGQFNLQNHSDIKKLELYSLHGELLFTQTPSQTPHLKIQPNAYYLIRITTNTNRNYYSSSLIMDAPQQIIQFSPQNIAQLTSAETRHQLIFDKENYFAEDHSYTGDTLGMEIKLTPDHSHLAFDDTQIRTYEFTVSPEDSKTMVTDALEENYIPASLVVDGDSIGEVGLRYKGSDYSLGLCFDKNRGRLRITDKNKQCKKVSLKIKFNEYDKDKRLFGLKKVDLLSLHEWNMFRNKMGYDLFTEFGVTSPRTAFSKVYINGIFQGIHLTTENIDGRFTKHHFAPNGNGNVFKEIWPNNQSEKTYLAHLKTNDDPEDNPDVSDMQAFSQAITNSDVNTFLDNIDPWIDIENFLRYLAVDRATNNWDGITAWYAKHTAHNYYWVQEGKGDRFWLVPWDLDHSFETLFLDVFRDWNYKPTYNTPQWSTIYYHPGADSLLNFTAQTKWDRFHELGNELLKDYFNEPYLHTRMKHWFDLIDETVQQDTILDYDLWLTEYGIMKEDAIPQLIEAFKNHIREGYIEEPADSLLDIPTESYTGLVTDKVNNFEVNTSIDSASWFNIEAPSKTLTQLIHNDSGVISGSQDMKLSFTINLEHSDKHNPATKSLKVYWDLYSKDTIDLNDFSKILIASKLDIQRLVRFEVLSPAYSEFTIPNSDKPLPYLLGWDVSMNPNEFSPLVVDNMTYGFWVPSNVPDVEKVKETVMTQMTGLKVTVFCECDTEGTMINDSDEGFIQIDNIIFQK